jgi:SAM-dependent methyltransferase
VLARVRQTRPYAAAKGRSLALPLPAWQALSALRSPRACAQNPARRREARLERQLHRALRTGATPEPPLGPQSAGASERVIEIPWVLSRVPRRRAAHVLDLGTAFAPFFYRWALGELAQQVDLHVADLVPVSISGATFHNADIRVLPFPDQTFDAVLCLSTLEHIGMDNRRYGVDGDAGTERPDVEALRELRRVTRKHGNIFITVPAGIAAEYTWFRQYSADSWSAAVAQASLDLHEVDYFTHDRTRGWRSAGPLDLETRDYGAGASNAAALICASLTR